LHGKREITHRGEIAVALGEGRNFDHGRRRCGASAGAASPTRTARNRTRLPASWWHRTQRPTLNLKN
jgi:hypothetical protein